jgi:tetratricopeptide (TPR) repeat protein
VRYLTLALQRNPDLVQAHRCLAAVYYDLGSMHLAIRHSEEVGRLAPEDGRPFRFIGQINKDYYQIQPAIDAYQEALRRRLAEATRAEVIKELAEVLISHTARYTEALDLLSRCPPAFAGKPEILALRAECLWRQGQESEAVAVLDRAMEQAPDARYSIILRGVMYKDAEQPEHALPFLERAVRMDPHDHKTHNYLATLYQQMRDRMDRGAGALVACAEIGRQAGQDGAGLAVLSVVAGAGRALEQSYARLYAQEAKDRDLAQARLDQLTKLSSEAMNKPWDDQVRYEIAMIWLQMDRLQLARSWLEAALACNPGHVEARRVLDRLSLP